jgi:Dual specificity phosphatase, catalytic domain
MKTARRTALFVLFVLTVAAWPALKWVERSYAVPENHSEVEPGLWMGGYAEAPPPGTVATLNLCEFDDPYRTDVYIWDPIRDAAPAPSIDWLKKKVDWVESQHGAGKTTYVHCFAGRSRSGMVVTAYLMRTHGWSRDDAIARIRQKRPEIKINAAFQELLREWESVR